MTQRERDIYQIIKANPQISQNSIAEELGITRSAVSAYLVSMTKKGLIRGRGYILNDEGFCLLMGPGHIDIVTTCLDSGLRFGMHDSVETTIAYGGATKNIAQYLTRLDVAARGMFTVTSDSFGQNFLEDCKKNNIDCQDSLILNDCAMPIYNEISKNNGEIIAAATVIDNLAEYITPKFLTGKDPVLRAANKIVVHDSIPYSSLEYLTASYDNSKLIYLSTYYSQTMLHADLLPRFDTVFMSYSTAYHLCYGVQLPTKTIPTISELQALGRILKEKKYKCIIIPYSLSGSCIIHDDTCLVMEVSLKNPTDECRSHYRFFRDASLASVVKSKLNNASDHSLLLHLNATKLAVFSSIRISDNNYCEALVQSIAHSLELNTFRLEL